MDRDTRTRNSGGDSPSPTTLPFYLFAGRGSRAVHCRARWITDNYAYVVAPLATATTIRQQWRATAFVAPSTQKGSVRQRESQVELVSAEELFGTDSGREGLLLRFLGSRERVPAEAGKPAAAGVV